jgi:CheY-like chemotaxis protein
MYPNRTENYCCTGGGGAMSMSEYTPRRLKSAKVKADQLAATGAKVVVTSCHNCVDGLTDLIRHYKLGMGVSQLVNLVANAIVVPAQVAVPEAVEEVPKEAVAEEQALQGYKILVVDDEPDILVYYTALLEDNGARVFEAPDGDKALALARSEKPDLITLDLSMPGTDGGKVFETLRKDPELSQIPVCIITGKPELRRLIYDRPVREPEGFLDKPVDDETLLLNVRKILEVGDKPGD